MEHGLVIKNTGSWYIVKTDDGKEFVRVIQIANYESGKLTYTVSFFEDGAVAGFFVKQ